MNEVAQRIAAEIASGGAVPFERFMELALYCPVCGYYEKEEDSIGRAGDYYTSVSVGGLFGELLAWQFAEWLERDFPATLQEAAASAPGTGPEAISEAGARAGPPPAAGRPPGAGPVQVVEAGAHRGELAGDILRWMQHERPALFHRLDYCIVEPSPSRVTRQRQRLAEFIGKVRWVSGLSELAATPDLSRPTACWQRVHGVIFSNELLDALPVRRFGWDARQRLWFEWGVALEGERFVWTRMPLANPPPGRTSSASPARARQSGAREPGSDQRLPCSRELLEVLPDGFTVEANPAAEQWWREAARVLERGRLLTIDYGLTAKERFVPERRDGTVRAFRRHQVSHDVLAAPGEQDITAHVDFSAILEAGEAAGLRTEGLFSQEQFLAGIAARLWKGGALPAEWTADKTRQFQTLTHPEHLGRAFRVLVQARE